MNLLDLLVITAVLGPAAAPAPAPERTDCIYDYRMITDRECRAYRAQVLNARSEEERLVLHDALRKRMDARALERGVSPDDWRGLAAIPERASSNVSGAVNVAVLTVALGTLVAIAVFVVVALWPVRRMRLMRCPETGTIAFVDAACAPRGDGPARVAVRSCELWPRQSHCARGCLERYEQAVPGLGTRVEALRPFHQP